MHLAVRTCGQGQEPLPRLALLESRSAWTTRVGKPTVCKVRGSLIDWLIDWWRPCMRPRFAVLLFALTFSAHAQAQEGHLGAGHDKWHQSFYNALQRPDGKGSCCNLTDCRPTSGRTVDDHYEVKVNGAWISVPQTKIIHRSAPDGGYHVCAPYNFRGNPEELYCVIVAPEG
jgi:hypothetical protein